MDAKKVHIKSFGCQMNKLDSSLVSAALKDNGFDLTDQAENADIVLINTCSVRENAENRVFSHLGHLKYLKKTNPSLIVGIIGCMAQRLGAELMEHPAVDIVAGPAQIAQIPQMIERSLSDHAKTVSITDKIRITGTEDLSEDLDSFEVAYDSDDDYIHNQAFVRIMRGCNKFCTYCIVPYVRGPEVSRSPHAIIDQIKNLAAKGIKQVTLLGQTVNSYTFTEGDKTYTLADLLEMASEIEGIKWIRFITSHPKNFDDSILKAMADLPKVCKYLHIPAQSGSDTILKAMNRGYTATEYLDFIERAKQIVPDIAIASDFIVGFPGETDEDFQATVELVRKAEYKNCFVFKYSPRPGTHTDKKLEDSIPDEVKKQRNATLLQMQTKISEEHNKKFLGQTVEVLVEGLSKKPHIDQDQNNGNPQLVGRTATDYIVVFNGSESLAGQFANVKITKTASLTLFGNL